MFNREQDQSLEDYLEQTTIEFCDALAVAQVTQLAQALTVVFDQIRQSGIAEDQIKLAIQMSFPCL